MSSVENVVLTAGYLRVLYDIAVGIPAAPGCELHRFLAGQTSPEFMASYIAERLDPGASRHIRLQTDTDNVH